ncbi:MAG: hypothetical protein M3042_01220 [Actinomycetota bacterium]|nr:hypothetical protein [Actinomycetota bacterium]
MNIFGILTLVGVVLTLGAVALFLILYLIALRRTMRTLSTVNAGVRAIARRVEPLEPVLADVNANLGAARDALAAVLHG